MTPDLITSRLREALVKNDNLLKNMPAWTDKLAEALTPVFASLLEEENRLLQAENTRVQLYATDMEKRAEQAEAETRALREALVEAAQHLREAGVSSIKTQMALRTLDRADQRLTTSSATPGRTK